MMEDYVYENLQSIKGATNPCPRERIVSCRNCQHVEHIPEWRPDGDRRYKPREVWICRAEQWEGFEGDNPFVVPDGFCAWGERRSE